MCINLQREHIYLGVRTVLKIGDIFMSQTTNIGTLLNSCTNIQIDPCVFLPLSLSAKTYVCIPSNIIHTTHCTPPYPTPRARPLFRRYSSVVPEWHAALMGIC